MTIEQFLKSKSKEEIAFIYYDKGNYKKCNCIYCKFLEEDEYKNWKCRSLFQEECRREFYKWLETEV